MNQLIIIYLAIFCSVFLLVQAAYWIYSEGKQTRGAVNRRLQIGKEGSATRETFELLRRERGLASLESGRLQGLNEFLTQTGLPLNSRLIGVFAFSFSLFFFLLFGFVLGFGIVAILVGVAFSVLAMFLLAAVIRRKRIGRFAEQLPEAIDVIVRGVKAGYPFQIALALVAKEMSDPIGTEFGLTADELTFGSDLTSALQNLHRRVGENELNYLTMAIKVQTETGGDLAEILSRLSRLIRERAMLRLKVRAISAEGRLSAIVLSVFPFLLFGVVTLLKPDYYSGVSDNPIMGPCIVVGIVLLLVGNAIMYKMVNFKV